MPRTILLLALPAGAAPPSQPHLGARYKDVTDIDIDAVRVDGAAARPLGIAAFEKRRATFQPLLHLRADFDREMEESVLQVR
jgi:hypothetical protein